MTDGSSRAPRVEIALLAYPGFDELDLFGAHSVLAKAADLNPGAVIRIAARGPRVTSSAGVVVAATASLAMARRADAVVIPGGRGAQQAAADNELLDVLRVAADHGAALYGVCSGSLLIAAAGLTGSRRVAVHHGKRGLLRQHPVGEVVSGLVRDGQVCTVGGDRRESVKSVDLAFALLTDYLPHTVEPVAQRMEIHPGRIPPASAAAGQP